MNMMPNLSGEAARLDALRRYRILDTSGEKSFDDLTRLASFICACPIALLSLLDEHRQWFKSKVGLSVSETQRDISFCTHTILQKDIMVVKDATRDERFRDSPLVRGEPHVCFYAGVPLVTAEGYALGAFCVIDHQPRELSEEQVFALRALARQTMALMELRRVSADLNEVIASLQMLQGLLPICSNCKKIRDKDGAWHRMEEYISAHSEAVFSHGVCPMCLKNFYTDFQV